MSQYFVGRRPGAVLPSTKLARINSRCLSSRSASWAGRRCRNAGAAAAARVRVMGIILREFGKHLIEQGAYLPRVFAADNVFPNETDVRGAARALAFTLICLLETWPISPTPIAPVRRLPHGPARKVFTRWCAFLQTFGVGLTLA
ncbi:hypothetical protein BURKHO8Y_10094 [Burkholderia sp. 8Y]|nr:hypothetical protein BURKHO8Y_10094 [Burkholderia sp. 8Y]